MMKSVTSETVGWRCRRICKKTKEGSADDFSFSLFSCTFSRDRSLDGRVGEFSFKKASIMNIVHLIERPAYTILCT
jgi:hypothetical protein